MCQFFNIPITEAYVTKSFNVKMNQEHISTNVTNSYGMIILKLNLEKQNGEMQIGFKWHMIGTGMGACEQ